MIEKNIFIGNETGMDFEEGSFNIFLGDRINGIKKCSNKFILKTEVGTLEKDITEEQWESFNRIIRGATLHYNLSIWQKIINKFK